MLNISNLIDKLFPDVKTFSGEFDIENNDVYGIERLPGNRTLISYYNKQDINKEFVFICPLSLHNEMVNRFKIKLKLNNDHLLSE